MSTDNPRWGASRNFAGFFGNLTGGEIRSLAGICSSGHVPDLIGEPTRVASYVDGAEKEIAEKGRLLEVIDREHGRLKTEIEKLSQLFYASALTPDQFKEKFQPLEQRRSRSKARGQSSKAN